MGSDSISANANAPIQSVPKDLGNKKKRANRNAKLKQCKMDVRREQWLSQVGKNKGGCKEERGRDRISPVQDKRDLDNVEVKQNGVGEMDLHEHHHEDSDLDSFTSSPTRAGSVLSDKDSGSNFTGSSSSSSSSSSSGGCCSGSITEAEDEEEEDTGGNDGCLDDWEAMADALEGDDRKKTPSSDQVVEQEPIVKNTSDSKLGLLGSKPDTASRRQGNTRAWRSDDASRPHSLPKQLSLPSSDRFPKPPCPICYEELDETELSFQPCLCGFRLCLFCHKRILEEDGRCPGCRKPYEKNHIETEASVTFRFGRSCSMITRS